MTPAAIAGLTHNPGASSLGKGRQVLRRLSVGMAAVVVMLMFVVPAKSDDQQEAVDFFEKKIRPVLIEHCYECHAVKSDGEPPKGGLLLDSRVSARRGGDSGPAIVPGEPAESLILDALRFESFEMPPRGKLPDDVIADFVTWIKLGAPDPREEVSRPTSAGGIDLQAGREYWAFQPPRLANPPAVQQADWVRNEIDHWILAKLEQVGITPVADADRRTLIRRVTFDLTGLPPTPAAVDAFVNDAAPDAYERVVDALLASQDFGERWGRHWLDLARYADSNGGDIDFTYFEAWRYRNYVIESFNDDKRYDRFLLEQLAGDLLPADNDQERADNLIATGFLAIGAKMLSERDKEKLRMDVVDEQIDSIGRAMQALTLGCARCHDHKFDPIPTADYYAMAGVFRSTATLAEKERQQFVSDWRLRPLPIADEHAAALKQHSQAVAALKKDLKTGQAELKKLEAAVVEAAKQKPTAAVESEPAKVSPEAVSPNAASAEAVSLEDQRAAVKMRVEEMQAQLKALEKQAPPPAPMAMSVEDHAETSDYAVAIRGNVRRLGAPVPRRYLEVMFDGEPFAVAESQSGRLELAQAIISPENPLTARVAVNRIWHHLFGQGIVGTPDNFGRLGLRPTHPELLDLLATRFMERDWSIKRAVRQIVLSRTYGLSTAVDSTGRQVDPDNLLYWRSNRRRLDAESLRDAILSVSGRLQKAGHKSPVATMGSRAKSTATEKLEVRSIYLPVVRSSMAPIMEVFDAADPEVTTGQRASTTVPTQALLMLNGPLILQQARHAARSLLEDPTLSDEQRVNVFYQRALARPATADEQQAAVDYVRACVTLESVATATAEPAMPETGETSEKDEQPRKPTEQARQQAWSSFCQAVFASTEFRFVE